MKKILIFYAGTHPAVKFAAEELAKYLKKGTGIPCSITRRKKEDADFVLGVSEILGIKRSPKITDEDDWIFITPWKKNYILTGSNPRSVLFAVYRYLSELGFRWIRPGKTGEIIPKINRFLPKKSLKVNEAPSYRFRTLCIEGATSYQHIINLIDWETKHGMNGYFIQFDYGIHFFKRWYEHPDNPFWKGKPFSQEDSRKVVEGIIREIKKRGLRFERMGHGWTCRAIGIEGEGWDPTQQNIPEEKKEFLALLNGKRDLFNNVPLNTNLCYSNPAVRNAMTDKIVEYARAHPEVDALHFWLADGSNNNCECENCMKRRVSDFYVDMLNELDEKLTARNIPVKIVFLIYVDLLWAPEYSRINNPDRFILMFAPITRSYSRPFCDSRKSTEHITPYVKNKLQFPRDATANIEYLEMWQKVFNGSGVDFDYHIIWPCYYDLNQIGLARVLHKDVQSLSCIGLHGFISCQNQRASFPHNLLMDVLAKTLWNKKTPFNSILHNTFADAYGKDGKRAVDFFSEMSLLWKPFFEPAFIPSTDRKRIARGQKNIPKIKMLAEEFAPLVRKNLKTQAGAVLLSWKYLDEYLKILNYLVPAMEAYLKRSPDCREKFEALFTHLWKKEKFLHPVLDVSTYVKVLQWRINEAENKV